jgi:hypothetical protein
MHFSHDISATHPEKQWKSFLQSHAEPHILYQLGFSSVLLGKLIPGLHERKCSQSCCNFA